MMIATSMGRPDETNGYNVTVGDNILIETIYDREDNMVERICYCYYSVVAMLVTMGEHSYLRLNKQACFL